MSQPFAGSDAKRPVRLWIYSRPLGDRIQHSRAFQVSVKNADAAFNEQSEPIGEGLRESAAALAQFAESVTSVSGTLSREISVSKQALSALEADVSVHLKSITETRSAIEADLEAVRDHRNSAAKMLEESRNAVQEVERSLVSLSRSIVEQLGGR